MQNMLKTKAKNFFFVLGMLCLLLFCIRMWVVLTFGEIHILQILWHIEKAHTLTGFDQNITLHFCLAMGICLALCWLWYRLFYKRKFLKEKTFDHFFSFLIVLFCFFVSYDMYHTFAFEEFIKMEQAEYDEKKDFFLHHYSVPKSEDVVFEHKNNLIIILLESFAANLRVTEDDTTCYIPRLETLYTKYQHHGQLINCTGSTWTIGALTSWFFGVPLKLPYGVDKNKYLTESFLPHATSIFDIIAENGYANYLFLGSYAKFAGMNYLFKRGNFTIYDSKYFEEQGKINEENTSEWGVRDFFLYDEVYKKYLELRMQDTPFVLFMQTIDTHFPGYCSEEKRKYGDIRDSWLDADGMLYDFMQKMVPFIEQDNVTILIFGDHTPMGKTLAANRKSPLFNLFAGKNAPQIPADKLTQKINPMDIAPTILQAAGAKWNNNQFGLGISIFSEDKSFSETEGIEQLDEKLLYYSKFYDKFF